MHSKKVAFVLIMGMMMTTAWAESAPEEKPATVAQPTATTSSDSQPEVHVEDIDAPILE